MPELTFSFDAPLEANDISNEDTQAQLAVLGALKLPGRASMVLGGAKSVLGAP
jgi:hypothetical protein